VEVKDVIDALDPKMKEYKEQLKSEVSAIDTKTSQLIAELNEDAKKKGETLGELSEKVNKVIANQGKLKEVNEASMSFKDAMAQSLAENFDKLANFKGGNDVVNFTTKAVADMTLSGMLTGNGVATYSLDPAIRGRRKVHFRGIPGVGVVQSATGIWKFFQNNTPAGEGSFGAQTEGNTKAQIDYDFTEKTVNVDTIAGFSVITRQSMRDLPFMQSFLPGELQEDYLRAEDNSFINTLMAGTSAYTTTATVYAEKCIEWISAIMARDYDPTSIVTTAANWATLLSTKPSDYSIPGGVTITNNGEVAIAGVPVVVFNGMTTGKTFIGDFSRVKIVQSSGLAVQFFEQDSTNVRQNKVTVRAEAEVALAVLRSDWGIYA
jgi:HK97 family phage major capsid protein